MNSDNKFGICCGCPAISNTPLDLTLWGSSRTYNYNMMKRFGTSNSNDFRTSLQSNAVSIMSKTHDDFNNNFKCKNTSSNIFYIDSTDFNNYYNNLNVNVGIAIGTNEKGQSNRLLYSIENDNDMNLLLLSNVPSSTSRSPN